MVVCVVNEKKKVVVVNTDGACRGNPGPGGWGAILEWGDVKKELYGAEPHTTNNRMELLAVISALTELHCSSKVILRSDSNYVLQGISKWIENWKKNGWKSSNKKPIKNQDLWIALDKQVQRHDVDWQWVKGHSGDPGNERADALANIGIDNYLKEVSA